MDRIAQLEKMLAIDPHDAFCLYGLAMEYARDGRHQQAIAHFDRTLAVDPDYCYAYFHKARVQEESNDLDGAIASLRAGLQRARACGDMKACSEIAAYLDQLT